MPEGICGGRGDYVPPDPRCGDENFFAILVADFPGLRILPPEAWKSEGKKGSV